MHLILTIVAIGMLPYSLAGSTPSDCDPIGAPSGGICPWDDVHCSGTFTYNGDEAVCPAGNEIVAATTEDDGVTQGWEYVAKLVCKEKTWTIDYGPTHKTSGFRCFAGKVKCVGFKQLDCPAGKTCQEPTKLFGGKVMTCPDGTELFKNDANKDSTFTFFHCDVIVDGWYGWQPKGTELEVTCVDSRDSSASTNPPEDTAAFTHPFTLSALCLFLLTLL